MRKDGIQTRKRKPKKSSSSKQQDSNKEEQAPAHTEGTYYEGIHALYCVA